MIGEVVDKRTYYSRIAYYCFGCQVAEAEDGMEKCIRLRPGRMEIGSRCSCLIECIDSTNPNEARDRWTATFDHTEKYGLKDLAVAGVDPI
jgi:hypothetical protein